MSRAHAVPSLSVLLLVSLAVPAAAQRGGLTPEQIARRWEVENQLQAEAVVERKVMLEMQDGTRIPADVYRPRSVPAGGVPTIWVRTPYNFNWWDVANGAPRDMGRQLAAVRRGYAWVDMQERGHFFAEGSYEILGAPLSDGREELDWITGQPWSNGKVGTTGCSSTAEWQPAVASLGHPGFAAMNVQGFGAGVGRVGPYWEMGNWYRGGAVQMLFISWLYGQQNPVRPLFPRGVSREALVEASKVYDLAPRHAPVDWSEAFWTLPEADIIDAVGGQPGIFADSMPVPTGGAMIRRAPDDPAWFRGGLWHDDMPLDVPGLWFMSWYDVSIGPNLAMFDHVRRTAKGGVGEQQWAIIAPVGHCAYTRATESTVVGERDVGDARWDYQAMIDGFFDRFVKGEGGEVLDTTPKVRYYTMGADEWRASDTWPPPEARPVTFYLSSGGHANTLDGDGVLTLEAPDGDRPDGFTYDPMDPVISHGGNVCCQGNAVVPGSLDQRETEGRADVLVYTTEPFEEGLEITGSIVPTLYVSSDARDTDFTVKVVDVYPDGRAFNVDESIQRMRYREGYERRAWMEPGEVYEVSLQPLNTSNFFGPGHRLRIEVSSSNFPRFDRNLNTGGANWNESGGMVAHNVVHHSARYPSRLVVSVVER